MFCSKVINELIEDLTKLDLVGERIPLARMHNNNKERRHEVKTKTNKYIGMLVYQRVCEQSSDNCKASVNEVQTIVKLV